MTVSATSSPVVLLTNAVEPAKAAASVAASPSGDAGAGEFQQLLAQAAEGAGAAAGVALLAGKAAPEGATSAAEAAGEDGNPLPLSAELLPLVPVAPTATDGDTKLEADSASRKDSDDQSDQADQAVTLLVNMPAQPPVPVVPANTVSIPIQAATGQVQAAALSAAQPAAPLLKGDNGVGAKSAINPAAGTNTDDALAIAATTTKTTSTAAVDPATLNAGGDGANAQGDQGNADFAGLLKQLDASAAGPSSGSIDSGRAVQQADRAYQQASPATATVSLPVASDGWHDAVADKVMWFGANKITSAEIHLNPPDLGPIQVRISTENDKASVYFTSQHASVREALDQALPRLRDMMGGQGIQLANAGVGGQGSSPQQQDYRGNSEGRSRSADGFLRERDEGAEPIGVSAVATARLARSGIDAYA